MPPPRERSWWSRHWMWALPVGCLTPFFVCGGGLLLMVTILFGSMKTSGAYTEAVARAKASPEVQAALGDPIQEGFFPSGKFETNYDNGVDSGKADLSIPLTGPKGSGNILVVAEKIDGKWTYSKLQVAVPGQNSPIDLLADKP